jgi:predicted RNase H-like HicB family nuclease
MNPAVQHHPEGHSMQTIKYVHWHENNSWLGYIEEYPDYWTQGDTLADLVEHLKDLYLDLSGDHIPGIRKVGELVMP